MTDNTYDPMIDHDVRSTPASPGRSATDRLDGDGWTGIVLIATLVAMVLVTGLNFTFAAAVMPNLADADDRTFVEIMQRFNQNPVFAVTFTGTLPLAAVAAWLHRRHGPSAAARWTVAALVLFAVMLVITFVINVPLNYEIDEAGNPDVAANLADVRDQVEGPWIIANIVRTLLATAAVAALGWALLQHRRSPGGSDAAPNATRSSWPPPTATTPSP